MPWDAKGFTGKQQFVTAPWGHYCPCFANRGLLRWMGPFKVRGLVHGSVETQNLALKNDKACSASV